jgi:iron complex outermembrane recepter protein
MKRLHSKSIMLTSAAFLALVGACPAVYAQADQAAEEKSAEVDEIIVTATRNSEAISKVPLSISAFSQEKMDTLGVKTIADIAALTPGVTFTQRKAVAIRGIVSNAGAGTTGIYIDETPIQIYNAGAFVTDAVPALFDLDRVEVLRGPQGTLFGSGSMGGTVRYITPQPNLSEYSVYARGEASFVDNGGPSFEGGVAVGGPISQDKLGFRASGYYRRDGGWIDRVDRSTGAVADKEANWGESYALRAALTWQPVNGVEFTPAVFHQYRYNNASQGFPITTGDGTSASWEGFSNPDKGIFRSGARIPTPGRDRSTLYSLTTKIDVGTAQLIGSTAYYNRKNHNITDSSTYDSFFLGATITPTSVNIPGFGDWDSYDEIYSTQKSFSQEVRIQSGRDQPLRWVAGVFYEHNKQFNTESFHTPSLDALMGTPSTVRGDLGFFGQIASKNTQIAGFAQVDFDVTEQITLTAGIRKAQLKYSFDGENDGFYNGGFTSANGSTKDSPWTPKFGAQFKADDNNLFYANVAKGFRTGGANAPIANTVCGGDLNAIGFSAAPATYNSDSVWNYEVGAKNKLFGNKLQISSSAFRVDWSQIQSRVFLPCGFFIVGNLGKAKSQGFDIQLSGRVADGVTLGANVGYNDAKYMQTLATSVPGTNLVTKGDKLPISPWTATVTGDFDFDLAGKSSYVHAEYRYQSGYPNLIEQNPANAGTFNPDYYDRPATNLVYLRAGMRFDTVDVSVFANNLLNSSTTTGRASDNGTPLFIINNVQPRVVGVTITYRQ